MVRCTRAAALAAAMIVVVSGTACGSQSEDAWNAERDNSAWTQHVTDAGAPLTADEFKTTTWRAGNDDMVMFHDTSEAWPHMEMPTVRSADDHHSTLIPESVKDQSELLQFEFLQYADVKLDGAYYAVSTYFPDDPANMSTSAWSKGADGDLFVLAVNDKSHEGYRVRATQTELDAQCMTDGLGGDATCYEVLFDGLAQEAKANNGILTLEHVDMSTGDGSATE